MLHKFEPDVRFPLTTAFSLSAVMAAMVAFAPSAQAQSVPCVGPIPQDPNNASGPVGTPSGTCSQYFAAGATFSALVNRRFFDYYGIAIPAGASINPGQPDARGYQTSSPSGSPRNTNQQFNYCSTGSANGRAIFTGVPATSASFASCSYATAFSSGTFNGLSPVAVAGAGQVAPFQTNVGGVTPTFAGSDTPMAQGDITDYTNTYLATRGNPIQVPTVFGMIDIAYNPSVIAGGATGGLSLTTLDLCRIFDGTYTDYSQISGTPGLSGTIKVFVASSASSSPTNTSTITTKFTTYLASVCPSVTGGSYYLTTGTNFFPNVPQTFGFTSTMGNEVRVADLVATTQGGLGYVQASFAQPYSMNAPYTIATPAPFLASLQNPVSGSFVFPTVTALNRGLTGVSLTPNGTYSCVLTVAGLPVVPTVGTAFPIISPTYTLAYTRYPTTAEANAVKNLYNFVLGNRSVPFPQANDQIAQGLGFSVLNSNSTSVVTNTLRGSARSCINTITSP